MRSLQTTLVRSLGLVSGLGLAAVFAASISAFIRDPSRTVGVVRELGLRPPRGLAVAAVSTEAAIVSALFVAPAIGGAAAVGYLSAVTGVMATAKALGSPIDDCGCFEERHPVDAEYFVRNAVLASAAGVALATAPRGSLRSALAAGTIAAASVGGLAYWILPTENDTERGESVSV